MKKMNKLFAVLMMMVLIVTMLVPVEASAAKKKLSVFTSVNSKTLKVKQKVQLKAYYTSGSSMKNVTSKAVYKSNNSKVVSVSKKGKVTAKKAGKATITVKYSGKSKKVTFSVQAKQQHQHVWKPNVVTEYEKGVKYVCNCGYVFGTVYSQEEYDEVRPIIKEHQKEHLRNGEPENYGSNTVYREVSHIDGYYCECGAKKD